MIRITGVTVLLLSLAAGAGAQQKKRVAVLNFDYATVRSSVSSIFGTNQDIGKGIADMLVDKLVASGAYSVIERKAIDKIMAEQNFANSDRVDSSTAAKIGRILGVDAIIMGSITQFGRDDKSTAVGGGAIGGVTGRFGLGGVSRSKATAVVGITTRMVDATTAEILATASGKGESTRSGTGLLGKGGNAGTAAGGLVDMRSANFADTVIGEATGKAVVELAGQLNGRASALPARTVSIDGLVADAAPDGTVIINVGSRGGVKVGDKLVVRRKVREVRDPASGKILRSVEDNIGEMVVTQVDEGSAVGKFSGAGQAKVGDTVKNQ